MSKNGQKRNFINSSHSECAVECNYNRIALNFASMMMMIEDFYAQQILTPAIFNVCSAKKD